MQTIDQRKIVMAILISNILDHRTKKIIRGSAGRSYNDKSVTPSEKYRNVYVVCPTIELKICKANFYRIERKKQRWSICLDLKFQHFLQKY